MYKKNTKHTVIVADGRFPTHKLPLNFLSTAHYIVCCDGAINYLDTIGIIPDIIIGDMDSVSAENKEKYNHLIQSDSDQETNDLTKAVNFCVKNDKRNLIILGATGLREDHAIGNIALLAQYAQLTDVSMVTNFGTFRAIHSNTTFSSFKGQQVSIFSLNPSLGIDSEGLQYPLSGVSLNAWWKGTLNQSLGASFALNLNTESPVIVFQTHEKKA